MIKPKKEKKPLTKQQTMANDPLWNLVWEYRISGEDNKADELKDKILSKYK